MFLRTIEINDESFVTDIVAKDYRTSGVFSKYGIEFCCGGRVPLQMACEMHGVDKEVLKKELNESVRNIQVTNVIDFNNWEPGFLIDYILNIHHTYLIKNLPVINDILEHFTESHKTKYTWLPELLNSYKILYNVLLLHIEHEEQVIFPYIKQIVHAHNHHEPYAALLVRTLRKPVEDIMKADHENVEKFLLKSRALTNNYTAPSNSCITHKVCFSKLLELDNDLVQHFHLENTILFPKAIAMEKEMLQGE
jgi:regulator of cell morphogenesis and NO signaling